MPHLVRVFEGSVLDLLVHGGLDVPPGDVEDVDVRREADVLAVVAGDRGGLLGFFENAFFENAFFENAFFENSFFENFA